MKTIPLAERMRPKKITEIIGQEHLVGEHGVFKKWIASQYLPSLLFWGSPGTGKTTLAQVLAQELQLPFFSLSAVNAGVKEVRTTIEKAQELGKAILFIDEIHRFNKSQQDALLHAVEKGIIILIGATTENPSFEVNAALRSRCQVYVLNELTVSDLEKIVLKAISEDEYLKQKNIQIKEKEALFLYAGGDARKLLNLLELVVSSFNTLEVVITNEIVEKQLQKRIATYDKNGEYHYDIISAFIKSIRGSDPNAALYYLARMILGGEDPKFIARRLLILSAEDIGLANPNALLMANTCFQAVQVIGYPECDLILSETTIYLATSAKSNSAYAAIKEAKRLAEKTADAPVPLHLRNAPTQLMKDLNYGKNYAYAHSYEGNFVEMEFMPDTLKGQKIFEPGKNPREEEVRKLLKSWWKKYNY